MGISIDLEWHRTTISTELGPQAPSGVGLSDQAPRAENRCGD
jgi:hypothetical protein